MNNRILTALFALALCLCLFIGVVPAEADAATPIARCGHATNLLDKVDKKDPKCTETGAKFDYWECRICGKLYADAAGLQQVDASRCVIPATGHKWKTLAGGDYHWEQCETCSATQNSAKHTPGEWVTSDAGHKRSCTVCESALTDAPHDFATKRANDDGKTHSEVCKDCGYVKTEKVAHTIKATDNGDGTHDASCAYCDYKATVAHVSNDNNCACDISGCDATLHEFNSYKVHSSKVKHIVCCDKCRESALGAVWESCNFVYTPSTVIGNKATHVKQCEICGNDNGKIQESCIDGNNDCVCDICGGAMFHNWADTTACTYTSANSAKCEEDGNVDYAQCNKCRQYFLPNGQIVTKEETVIKALGHQWADMMSDDGTYHYYHCTRLDTFGSPICHELKDVGEHIYDKYVSDGNGNHRVYCSVCDSPETPAPVPCTDIANDGKCECKCGYAIPHELSNLKLVEAKVNTCTEPGNVAHFLCEECGGTFKNTNVGLVTIPNVVLAPSGHHLVIDETRGNIHSVVCDRVNRVRNAADTADFVSDRCNQRSYVGHQDTTGDCKCDLANESGVVCGAQLHTHNHKYQPAVEATCTTQGFEAYFYYAPCGRMFSDDTYTQEIEAPVSTGYADCEAGAWVNEGDNHVKRCENCNKVVDSGAHVDANGDNRCDVCNFELALDYVAEVPATCTTSGTKAHYISRVTQRKYWDAEGTKYISNTGDLVIKAYAHIDPVTGVGPIATDKGNGTHEYTCALCNRVTRTEAHTTGGCFCTVCGAGSSAKHVATVYPYQAPVCDKDGHEAYAQCSCGQYYNAAGEKVSGYSAVSIKATGHKWGAEVFNDDAAGKHYAVCEICNAKNYGEHEVTASDPLSGNYHQFVCECGEVSLEAHYDKNGDNVCDEAGCKRDLSDKKVTVNNNPSTTVVTGDKNTVNTGWSWLRNWLNNTVGSNAGGSTTPTQTAQPGTATGSQGNNTGNNGTTTTPATGSNTGSAGAGNNATYTPSTQGGNQTAEATGVLQAIIGFFNWILSGFGG